MAAVGVSSILARRVREEIHADFPMFGRIRQNFTRILSELQLSCSGLEPSDDTYKKLSWHQRERIFFYERAVADTILINAQESSKQLSEIYRLLGLFYGSHHASMFMDGRNIDEALLDRARFYFDRAIEIDPKNYCAYSHAGHFTMYFDNPELLASSQRYLGICCK
jgi:hypothetical protein